MIPLAANVFGVRESVDQCLYCVEVPKMKEEVLPMISLAAEVSGAEGEILMMILWVKSLCSCSQLITSYYSGGP